MYLNILINDDVYYCSTQIFTNIFEWQWHLYLYYTALSSVCGVLSIYSNLSINIHCLAKKVSLFLFKSANCSVMIWGYFFFFFLDRQSIFKTTAKSF